MHKFVLIALSFVLGACQAVTVQPDRDGPLPVSVRVDDVALWLEEWRQTTDLPKEQIKLALKSREADFERDADPRTRMRLALLLATGPASVRDQQRARVLVGYMDKTSAREATLALAALLQQVIEEQLWSAGKITALKRNLRHADARIAELEQQLQALTNIEQSIQQRETPVSRKEKE